MRVCHARSPKGESLGDTLLIDPLGRQITLHDRTWFGHIVKGHPEMAAHRALVEGAVKTPTEIRRSLADADCRLYFGPGPRKGVIMMVVSDVALGLVKTAHSARKASGGSVEWS